MHIFIGSLCHSRFILVYCTANDPLLVYAQVDSRPRGDETISRSPLKLWG